MARSQFFPLGLLTSILCYSVLPTGVCQDWCKGVLIAVYSEIKVYSYLLSAIIACGVASQVIY